MLTQDADFSDQRNGRESKLDDEDEHTRSPELREWAVRSVESPPAVVVTGTTRLGARHDERVGVGVAMRERVVARSAAVHALRSKVIVVRWSKRRAHGDLGLGHTKSVGGVREKERHGCVQREEGDQAHKAK